MSPGKEDERGAEKEVWALELAQFLWAENSRSLGPEMYLKKGSIEQAQVDIPLTTQNTLLEGRETLGLDQSMVSNLQVSRQMPRSKEVP